MVTKILLYVAFTMALDAAHGTYDDYAKEWHTPPKQCPDQLQHDIGVALNPFNSTTVTRRAESPLSTSTNPLFSPCPATAHAVSFATGRLGSGAAPGPSTQKAAAVTSQTAPRPIPHTGSYPDAPPPLRPGRRCPRLRRRSGISPTWSLCSRTIRTAPWGSTTTRAWAPSRCQAASPQRALRGSWLKVCVCGGPLQVMPAVQNQLIAQGAFMEHFFVNTPICCPSRTEFFTGRYAEALAQPPHPPPSSV